MKPPNPPFPASRLAMCPGAFRFLILLFCLDRAEAVVELAELFLRIRHLDRAELDVQQRRQSGGNFWIQPAGVDLANQSPPPGRARRWLFPILAKGPGCLPWQLVAFF